MHRQEQIFVRIRMNPTWLLAAAFTAGAVTGCERGTPPADRHDALAAHIPDSGATVGWAMYNLNYEGNRSSPLALIDTANVGRLRPVCRARLGEEGTLQAGPVVVGDTLFITTAHTTAALNATTCRKIWRFVDSTTSQDVYAVNRGVAYLDGRVFRGTPDGRLVALDSDSGRVLWNVKVGNPAIGEFLSSAPIAWHGTVFIGLAGSDWGVRGRVMAFDAATGKEKWRFWTVPMGTERGADSWKIPETAARGGGAMWSSYSLDTLSNELFVPVGNPSPDWAPESRPGDNLFTNSVVALDAGSGALKWWHQLTPHDGYDYDLGAAPTLYSAGGAARLALASKDGFLYSIDRGTQKRMFKTAVTTIKNPRAPPTAAGIHACPGALGGVEWNGPAYDSATHTIYVGAVDLCMKFVTGPAKYVPGGMYYATNATPTATDSARGWLVALDAGKGHVRWRFHAPAPVVAGVTHTAGGLVLTGDLAGNLFAIDKATGKAVYQANLGGAVAGGVVTYAVRGKQYVAATAGNVGRSTFGVLGSPTLVVLALSPATEHAATADGTNAITYFLPDVAAGAATSVVAGPNAPPAGAHAAQAPIDAGRKVFQLCATCHGSHGEGGVGANLQLSKRDLAGVTSYIKGPTGSMPKLYPNPLSDADVAAVAAYVMTLRK